MPSAVVHRHGGIAETHTATIFGVKMFNFVTRRLQGGERDIFCLATAEKDPEEPDKKRTGILPPSSGIHSAEAQACGKSQQPVATQRID